MSFSICFFIDVFFILTNIDSYRNIYYVLKRIGFVYRDHRIFDFVM